MDKVSVIIRNRNEAEYIGFALQSVCDFIPKAEVVVVDNNSTDDSLQVVNLFKDRLNLKVLTIDDYTPGRSINLGAQHVTNPTVLVLSAHCQLTKVNLEAVNIALTEQKHLAVFGQQNPIYKGKKITKRYIWSHFGDKEEVNMFSSIENRQFFHNAFTFYLKETLLNKPMPEQYSGKEDRYWAQDIVQEGSTYLYSPELKVNHFYTGNGATWKGLG